MGQTKTGKAEILRDTMRHCCYVAERSPLQMVAAEDITHTILYVNPAFCRLVGKEKSVLIGRSFAEAVPEGEDNECLSLLDRVHRTGEAESLADQEHWTSNAKRVYWSYTAWAICNADERSAGVMIQITDTTEAALFRHKMLLLNQELVLSGVRQHELQEAAEGLNVRLQALAITDGLTGLKNHRTFHERLREEAERATRYATPLSVLFLDVDEFKGYNDTYGHPAGDAALRKIGEALQAAARTNDLIARYGGEEFAIILPETDAANAILAAERFRAAIEAADWPERRITVSLGAATLSPTVCDSTALIHQADQALYRSKERGRNCVTHSMDTVPAVSIPTGPPLPDRRNTNGSADV